MFADHTKFIQNSRAPARHTTYTHIVRVNNTLHLIYYQYLLGTHVLRK